MSNAQASTFTDSALSDKVKEFLIRFKDKHGNYKYVNAIDEMMPKNAKYIIVDYNERKCLPEFMIRNDVNIADFKIVKLLMQTLTINL